MRVSIKRWNELQHSVEMWLKARNYNLINQLIEKLIEEGYDENHIVALIKSVEKKVILKSA
jgi:hypothetical protein